MKRDIKLVKEILNLIESSESVNATISLDNGSPLPSYSDLDITYHVDLLIEAGYIKGNVIKPEESDVFICAFLEMTWQGHEFLDVLKNKEVLNKIVSLSKEGITSLSFDVIKTLGKKLIEAKAEKLLGLSK